MKINKWIRYVLVVVFGLPLLWFWLLAAFDNPSYPTENPEINTEAYKDALQEANNTIKQVNSDISQIEWLTTYGDYQQVISAIEDLPDYNTVGISVR